MEIMLSNIFWNMALTQIGNEFSLQWKDELSSYRNTNSLQMSLKNVWRRQAEKTELL